MRTIRQVLSSTLLQVQTEWGITPIVAEVSVPTHRQNGDYSTNLAMMMWRGRSTWPSEVQARFESPRALAEALVSHLQHQPELHDVRFELAGPGFINMVLSDDYFSTLISSFNVSDTLSELPQEKKGLAIVEYSSPNIAKPFTIGHLRSSIIGDAVAHLLAATGWTVKRDNHLGDWGTQFGKQIYALIHLGKGSLEANLAELAATDEPVKYLVELYVDFHTRAETDRSLEDAARAWFKKLEDGDSEARRLWQLCIDYSWVEFSAIYTKLGITFTENAGRGFGESYFEDKMSAVLDELTAANETGKLSFATGKDDAKLVFFPDEELPPLMILKKDGATLYATRDLATDLWRKETYPDLQLIINEVGAEQSLYFEQIYRTESLLGWFAPEQRKHVKHGLYRFADKKMSTRKGNVIWLRDVLDEAEKRAAAIAEDRQLPAAVAAKVGIGALKWNDLKRSSHLDVTFDWDEILAMQGNSGPYMQYSYVRAANILRKAGSFTPDTSRTQTFALDVTEREVALKLAEYSNVVRQAATEFAPHHMCTYLFDLAQAFNSMYTQVQVLTEPDPALRAWRLQLVAATAATIKTGLSLLGIETVEEM